MILQLAPAFQNPGKGISRAMVMVSAMAVSLIGDLDPSRVLSIGAFPFDSAEFDKAVKSHPSFSFLKIKY